MKVYLLWSGDYSSVQIDAVVSTREGAERAKEMLNSDWIDERVLDSALYTEEGKTPFCVYIVRDLSYGPMVSKLSCGFIPEEDDCESFDERTYQVCVWARDENEAKALAIEKMRKRVAE